MKDKMKTRMLACLLSLTMVLLLIPDTALAVPESVPPTAAQITSSNCIISTGGDYYLDAGTVYYQVQISGGTESNPVTIYISGNVIYNNINPAVLSLFAIQNGVVKIIGVNNARITDKTNGNFVEAALLNADCDVSISNILFDGSDISTGAANMIFVGSEYGHTAKLTMTNCIVQNWHGDSTGAVCVQYNATAEITNCVFQNNTSSANAGAIGIFDDANVTIDSCTFKNNTSTGADGAGAIRTNSYWGISGCAVKIKNCTISGNSGAYGAVYLFDAKDKATLSGNTTITENTNTGGKTCNVYLSDSAKITLDNDWTGTTSVDIEETIPANTKRQITTVGTDEAMKSHITSGNSNYDVGYDSTNQHLYLINHIHRFDSWLYDSNNHWRICSCGEKDSFGAHSFGAWTITKTATATEAGSRERACECGYVETEVIPATGQIVIIGDRPDSSGEESSSKNPNTGAVSPQTGDYSNLLTWILLVTISAGAVGSVLFVRRRRTEKNR